MEDLARQGVIGAKAFIGNMGTAVDERGPNDGTAVRVSIDGQEVTAIKVEPFPIEVIDRIENPVELERALGKFDDDTLVNYGYQLQERTWSNWLKQCCVAHVLISRQEGWAAKLATMWGVSRNWVYELSAVWKRIIVPMVSGGESIPPLPPTFFHEALRAKDPVVAIREADDAKSLNPGFSVRDFRRAIAAKKKDSDEMVESCRHCRFLQILKDVPFRVVIEGKVYDVVGTIHACRYSGVMKVAIDWDPEAMAENCFHFWSRSQAEPRGD